MSAAATGCYKRILQVLEKWPVDKNKSGGRDLGEQLKIYINKAYKENKFEADTAFWDRQFVSMQVLLKNNHKNKYKRSLNSSATGLTSEQCNIALSNEFLSELQEENKSFFQKIFSVKKN